MKSPSSGNNSLHSLVDPEEIQDLSNSILEVSSTVVSFSSPGSELQDKDQNISIEEIHSPEIQAVAEITRLSDAEVVRAREELDRKQLLLKSCNVKSLPDGGRKLMEQIRKLKETLEGAAVAPLEKRQMAVPASTQNSEQEEEELRKQLNMKKVSLLKKKNFVAFWILIYLYVT